MPSQDNQDAHAVPGSHDASPVLDLAADIVGSLPFTPNSQQLKAAVALARFIAPGRGDLASAPSEDRVFILNGYAGTGKTSLVGAMVKVLTRRKTPLMLLAPTGRAAKVFAANAAHPAFTVHRKIYRHNLSGSTSFNAAVPQENKLRDAIFIVDEASMIGSETETGSNLLTDLIHFVYSAPGCRLILMGDTAQLPPVGQTESPAMTPDVLRAYGLKVTRVTLTDVARQAAGSGILRNATRLRRALAMSPDALPAVPPLTAERHGDVRAVEPDELPDLIDSLYRADTPDDTILITWSNLSAVRFNTAIRATVLEHEEELCVGDLLIAAKNNYHWTRSVKGLDFIANGEILRVTAIAGTERCFGLRFADVTLEPAERPGLEFQAKIILDSLTDPAAALCSDTTALLRRSIADDPDQMRQSPYWNALQVKYAYAVTCHKAQGGQWKNVIVDLSYVPPEQQAHDFYRWLYTAITRARSNLYLLNLPEN